MYSADGCRLNPISWMQKLASAVIPPYERSEKRIKDGVFNFDIPGQLCELGRMLDTRQYSRGTQGRNPVCDIDQDSTQMEDKIASVRQNCAYIKSWEYKDPPR